ncbi:putative glycosyl hydrolase [Astrocystis sublimbata]|nr:putative glycosyl hydrolase [Astrocystis sublimbata]
MAASIEVGPVEARRKLDYTTAEAGNPFVEGWYGEPGIACYDGVFWVYPTSSCPEIFQTAVDAFSSPDLINWTKHPNVLIRSNVAWVTDALWAPTPISRNGKYYLYFSANDLQEYVAGQHGGIGVAVADKPEGPFVDAIGEPLINSYHNGAQPIDPYVFVDDADGQAYIYYGGRSHANVAKLDGDMISINTFDDGSGFKEITPETYTEGAKIVKRKGRYYFMWSENRWDTASYCVSYGMADNPLGPFEKRRTILQGDDTVAHGPGHHSVIQVPNTDIWYIFYHRRRLGEQDKHRRTLAYDRMYFDEDGRIEPVTMLVKDNFADGAMLAWTTYGGEWSVEGQRLTATDASGGMAMLDTMFFDQVFDATVKTTKGNGHPGLLFRVTQLSKTTYKYKGYKAAISPMGVITLGKADLGVFTDLAQTKMDMELGQEYHVRVVAIGQDLKIFVDDMDKPKIHHTDDSFRYGANGVRVFNAAAKFGSVSVANPNLSQSLEYDLSIDRGRYSSTTISGDDTSSRLDAKHASNKGLEPNGKKSRFSFSPMFCGIDRIFHSNSNA